jgi:iron complex outermembrane receptor protein
MALALCSVADAAEDFTDLDLATLMNMDVMVTSVARKESRLFDSPAGVTVITAEDIRRSGLSTLPELLRTVPGLSVARINSNEWAITSRGFNDQYATKLLVLVDGRTIYTPMFSGVYWNANDIVLEDLDRIEVIRGPGAALWGANAVNGVINILTKSAADTQGSLLTSEYGTEQRPTAVLRYGSNVGRSGFYRAYIKHAEWHGVLDPQDGDPPDDWRNTRAGLRFDGQLSAADVLTAQGEYYEASVGEHFERLSLTAPLLEHTYPVHSNNGGHALVRWRRNFSSDSVLTVQSYYDRFHQWDGDNVETRDTVDIDMQHQLRAGTRHGVLWGLGYRYSDDSLPPTFYLSFFPARQSMSLYTGFLQDEIDLLPKRLALTLGAKLEHNEFTGFEFQPNLRLSWSPTARQFLWAAASRAVRTPGRFHFDSRLNVAVSQAPNAPPFLVALISSPAATSEELMAYEAGYRFESSRRYFFDVALYYNRYDKVFTYVPGPVSFESTPAPAHLLLPLTQTNLLHGHSYGGELSVHWMPIEDWQLSAGYSRLHIRLHPSNSAAAKDPQIQWQLRSDLNLPYRLQAHVAAYHVDGINSPLNDAVVALDSYLRLDVGLQWQATPDLDLSLRGQNLLDRRHAEFGSFKTSVLAEIPRSVTAGFALRF